MEIRVKFHSSISFFNVLFRLFFSDCFILYKPWNLAHTPLSNYLKNGYEVVGISRRHLGESVVPDSI